MSFEIQNLPDIIRIITFIRLGKAKSVEKSIVKGWIDKVCTSGACVDDSDIDRTIGEMAEEGLIRMEKHRMELTEQGADLSKRWQKFFGKKEPVLEVVAGLADGSITALVVILSAFIGSLAIGTTTFAAFLTLAAVAITNFSSFFLGGITEDISDLLNLHSLVHYSVSDIPNESERDKSLMLIQELFTVLHNDIRRRNTFAASICGVTTFLVGSIPISFYLYLPLPLNLVISICVVAVILGIFLVKYRTRRSRTNWKTTLLETAVIISIAVIGSLLLGSI